MAANIARAGIPLVVHNRTPGRARLALESGAVEASTPREAAAGADIVVTMLKGGDAVEDMLFGPHGAAAENVAGKLFVDMSTTGPEVAQRLSQRLSAQAASFVDAPVSGTREPAEKGELLVLAGGAPEDLRAEVARAVAAGLGGCDLFAIEHVYDEGPRA